MIRFQTQSTMLPTRSAAGLGIPIGALTYKSLASILQNNIDRASPAAESASVHDHPNVRGRDYFH